MRILIARYPVDASSLNFPYFYEAATKGLSEFAEVDTILLRDPDRPISQNWDLAPYNGVVSFGGRFTAECLNKAPRLRVVSGFACGEELLMRHEKIVFVELTGGWQRSVAELGIGLTLSCLRNIALWHSRMQANHEPWTMQQFSDDPSYVNGELYGKRVGLFGLGRIGQHYARLAKAFGAVVAARDPHVPDEIFTQLGIEHPDLDELLAWSQIFVISASPTAESRGTIDRRRVYLLPKGACLVVISRAWPLDMGAVRERIAAGELCGGFDVFDIEPLPPNDVLRCAPQVTLTPHVAGRCADSNRLMAEMVIEAFRKELAGKP